MKRASTIVSLTLLGTALCAAGCSEADKPSNATSKPAPATTKPVTSTTTPSTTKPAGEVTPLGSQTVAAAEADVAKMMESLPPVPSQDDADAAAAKAISDANADAEFQKLSSEIDSDKP